MAFFDFLKKKVEIVKETIHFADIPNWIDKSNKEFKIKDNVISQEITLRLKTLIINLEENIPVIKNIDLSKKKIEDRVRFIVKENLDKYIENLERFISNLRDISEYNTDSLIKKINFTVFSFEDRTKLQYEKATYLIGEDLEKIKKEISNFFKDTKVILEVNKSTLEMFKAIGDIEIILIKIKQQESLEKHSEEIIEEANKEIAKINKSIEDIVKKISEVKSSELYSNEKKIRQDIDLKNYELEKDIISLREFIDFKSLIKSYHTDSKKMEIIKDYKDDFKENFKKDKLEKILYLLIGINIETKNINDKIKAINEKKDNILEFEKNISKESQFEKVIIYEKDTKSLLVQIEDIKEEIDREKNKLSKFKIDKLEAMHSLENEFSKINYQVIYT
ncbi:MAG: hypothetical protein WC867_03450 [Candidatus Pacearchaeota archaeon]|jgi:hypothetical protein